MTSRLPATTSAPHEAAAIPGASEPLDVPPACLPACTFCRKGGDEVKLIVADPVNGNLCEHCAAEAIKIFVCNCVC